MKPLSFVIVGSGWRAMFYVRIALRYPQCFKLCYLLCRTKEKAERIRREYGIPVTTDAHLCEDARPDFIVVAVDRASKFAVTKQWLAKGFVVLSETPAAETVEELEELWALHQAGARLQIDSPPWDTYQPVSPQADRGAGGPVTYSIADICKFAIHKMQIFSA